ncbi:MAG: hypothetical protein KatS3mg023_3917 [Armatimonadota bacterium]|nr:MAG: hypothetical protein KatS3mg023_3917 [Armatimonadota bacterium]
MSDMLRTALRRLHIHPVAYYPIYAQIMGGTAEGVILSQILYWAAKFDAGEEFYKSDEEILAETGCSEWELRKAKRKLKQLEFLSVEVKGLPARTFYRVDWEKLLQVLGSETITPTNDQEEANRDSSGTLETPNQSRESLRTSCENASELVARTPPNQLREGLTTIHIVQETTQETTTEDISTSIDGADAQTSEQVLPTGKEEKRRHRSPQLHLHVEKPPRTGDKPNYYREVRTAFQEVTNADPDALTIRACLGAWKEVREGKHGTRGLSAEEITDLWRRARASAKPDFRERITLLWVLNNGEKARKMVEFAQRPPTDPSGYHIIDQTEEVVRLYFEAKAKREQEALYDRQ